MGGAARLCNYGANLSCAKTDVSRISKGAEAYCRAFPGSAIVPMAATGHETIYAWGCVGQTPHIKTSEKVDERGFIARNLRPLD